MYQLSDDLGASFRTDGDTDHCQHSCQSCRAVHAYGNPGTRALCLGTLALAPMPSWLPLFKRGAEHGPVH